MAVEQPISLSGRFRRISNALLDLVVPRRCGLCGQFDTFLCERCTALLPVASMPRCPTCWGLVDPRNACRSCALELVPSLAGLRCPYVMDGGARRLVHALKYDGLSALAEPMGHLMAACLVDWGISPDVIAPVPLHPSRRRRRGFNQAALLAHSLAKNTGISPDAKLLRRTRNTSTQVRTAGAEERRRNVAGAFAVSGSAYGRTVLLVDDVCTTGATLRSCATALRASGAVRVYALSFAREDLLSRSGARPR
jgi:ComF family protein